MCIAVVSDSFNNSLSRHFLQQASHSGVTESQETRDFGGGGSLVFLQVCRNRLLFLLCFNRLPIACQSLAASNGVPLLIKVTLKKLESSNVGTATFASFAASLILMMPVPICSI